MGKQMLERKTWEEFRAAGLLWWVNRILHLFGWAITCDVDLETNKVNEVYPARCRFRGFSEDSETEGFQNLTKHIVENAERLELDTRD